MIIAPRYIYQADLIIDEGIKHGVTMVKRSDMKAGKPIRSEYDGVILDTIGELGRVYSWATHLRRRQPGPYRRP